VPEADALARERAHEQGRRKARGDQSVECAEFAIGVLAGTSQFDQRRDCQYGSKGDQPSREGPDPPGRDRRAVWTQGQAT